MVVEVQMRVRSVLFEQEELLLPLANLLLLLEQISLHLDPFLALGIGLFAAFPQSGIDLLSRGFLGLLRPCGKCSVLLTSLLKERMVGSMFNKVCQGAQNI